MIGRRDLKKVLFYSILSRFLPSLPTPSPRRQPYLNSLHPPQTLSVLRWIIFREQENFIIDSIPQGLPLPSPLLSSSLLVFLLRVFPTLPPPHHPTLSHFFDRKLFAKRECKENVHRPVQTLCIRRCRCTDNLEHLPGSLVHTKVGSAV